MTNQTNTFKLGYSPRWIISVKGLPSKRTPAKYEVKTAGGTEVFVTLENRKRQVVDAMLLGPLFCASTVRLGDAVFRLKEDHSLYAVTLTTEEGRKFYSLRGQGVRRIDGTAS